MTNKELIELFHEAVGHVETANKKVPFVNPDGVLLTLVNGMIAIKEREEQDRKQGRDKLVPFPSYTQGGGGAG